MYSHWTVVANIIVERLAARTAVSAFGHGAADAVRARPHHLRVVADEGRLIVRRAVRKVLMLHKPGAQHEQPATKSRSY